MKKLIAVVFSVLSAAVFAGKDDVVISFSTQGPDTYKDGTQVVDGECYALVYTPKGSTFAGVNADGTAVPPSTNVLTAAVAKDGKCPLVMFQVDEGYCKSIDPNYGNGTWGVYLLDTRVFAVDKDGIVQKDGEDKPIVDHLDKKSVKGYGAVATANGTSLASVSAAKSQTGQASATEIKISNIEVIGENVQLTISGANAGLFELSAGNQPETNQMTPEGQDRASSNDKAYIILKKEVGAKFFQVNRK